MKTADNEKRGRPSSDAGRVRSFGLFGIAFVLALLIFFADIHTPAGLAIPFLYIIVVLYSWVLPGPMLSAYVALACSALVVAGGVVSGEFDVVVEGAASGSSGANRLLATLILWVASALVAIARVSIHGLEQARESLERHVAERTRDLATSEQRLRQMTEEVEDYAIIRLGPEGIIESWNRGGSRITGYEPDEVRGQHCKILLKPSKEETFSCDELLTGAREKGRRQFSGWCTRRGGEPFFVSVSVTALKGPDARVTGFTLVIRDLTERRRAEIEIEKRSREIEAKNAELEQFAYIASHDLQEPLRSMLSLTEMLGEQSDSLDDEGRTMLDYIQQSGLRMRKLISGLLNYSRLGRSADIGEVDCASIVQEVLADLAVRIEESKATVEIGDLPTILGYETEVRVLFQNLIGNALKFASPGVPPKVIVGCEQTQSGYRFKVKDNGIGIDPAFHEKVFVIFQRLHSRDRYEGTGIGLAYCRKVVDLHGGRIWLESSSGEGTTVFVELPSAQEPMRRSA